MDSMKLSILAAIALLAEERAETFKGSFLFWIYVRVSTQDIVKLLGLDERIITRNLNSLHRDDHLISKLWGHTWSLYPRAVELLKPGTVSG